MPLFKVYMIVSLSLGYCCAREHTSFLLCVGVFIVVTVVMCFAYSYNGV